MTKAELKKIVDNHTVCGSDYEAIWRAVDRYTAALIAAKPIVSGSLPAEDEIEAAGEKQLTLGFKRDYALGRRTGFFEGVKWFKNKVFGNDH